MPDTYREPMNDSSAPVPQAADDVAKTIGLGRAKTALPKFNRRWIYAGVGVVAALVIASRFMGGPAEPKFLFAEVTQGGLIVTVTATGQLQPRNQVEVGPEISGQIATVHVDFNDRVTEGQALAEMDTDNLKAKVLQARASLESAKAKLEETRATATEAQTKANRTRDLFGRGNASKQELDAAVAAESRAKAAVSSAVAQVAVAEANLAADETNLAKAEIKSPINGIVLSRKVEPGQVVAATFQTPVLFTLAEDLTAMELIVDVDEADIGQVREGQEAIFTVDAFPDRQFPATITQVRFAPKSAEGVVTYQAVLSVDNSDLLLRPGMTATAGITTATRGDATLVPNAALRFVPPGMGQTVNVDRGFGPPGGGQPPGLFRVFAPPPQTAQVAVAKKLPGGLQRVWVMADGRPTPVDVKVGLTDGTNTEVAEGTLTPGQQVMVGMERAAN
ncbi:MAG: efflux RND transporter periplasmic adaptor subunit [Rhodospirillaceae bacterium]|nr:efflux RND transporter periplasmic adaptor subunit [Rhodospirillaceae bacterium]